MVLQVGREPGLTRPDARTGQGRTDCTAYLENWDSYSRNGRTTALTLASFHCQRVTRPAPDRPPAPATGGPLAGASR
jgi:hypothetical protein